MTATTNHCPLCEASARRAEAAEARVKELEAALRAAYEEIKAIDTAYLIGAIEENDGRGRLKRINDARVAAYIALTPKEPRQ